MIFQHSWKGNYIEVLKWWPSTAPYWFGKTFWKVLGGVGEGEKHDKNIMHEKLIKNKHAYTKGNTEPVQV